MGRAQLRERPSVALEAHGRETALEIGPEREALPRRVRAQQLRVALPGWGSEPIVAHVIYRAAHRTRPQVRTVIDHLRTSYVEAPLADL